MRGMFPEYYYEPDFKKMWKEAIFVFDANVLLDVYRFTPETSKDLIKLLKHLKNQNRIWIPNQFAHEYLRNLPSIQGGVFQDYRDNKKTLKELQDQVIAWLEKFNDKTDFDLNARIDEIKTVFKTIKDGLNEHHKKHKDRLENDNIEAEIEELLAGRIGESYSDERMSKIFSDGVWRYRLGLPPGFKDSGKDESRRFGDLIGWLQIIDFAKEQHGKPPVVLVTRDSKDDWFYKPRRNDRRDNRIAGPRPELVKEMQEKAGVEFYIYQTGDFLNSANNYLALDRPVTGLAIDEARKAHVYDISSISEYVNQLYSAATIVEALPQFAETTNDRLKSLAAASINISNFAEQFKPDYSKLFPRYDPSMLTPDFSDLLFHQLPNTTKPRITPSTDNSTNEGKDTQDSDTADDNENDKDGTSS